MSKYCKNCKFFSKYRGIEHGQCNNDKVFQYADNKTDLVQFDNESLVLMGGAIPTVGINYYCAAFVSRKEEEICTSTNDFSFNKSFSPQAANKRGSINSRGVMSGMAAPPIRSRTS